MTTRVTITNDAGSPYSVRVLRRYEATLSVPYKEALLATLPPGASLSEHVWGQVDIVIREIEE